MRATAIGATGQREQDRGARLGVAEQLGAIGRQAVGEGLSEHADDRHADQHADHRQRGRGQGHAHPERILPAALEPPRVGRGVGGGRKLRWTEVRQIGPRNDR